ncbi:RNA polymerase II transcription elongation factor-domain-containing protein [Podospora conica]|nr:RNA polymerase II transcription elongation factor-domain-containing protein [Schizothecium conicum]
MAAPATVDPSKAGKYPIFLSDALLGKPSKETYTGIRYNHRPELTSDAAPNTARLKKSAKDNSYNLGFDDNGDKYQYNGARTTDDNNFVLIFDPVRQGFVLHRVDSTFHMNLTRTPTDGNQESLRKQFPHLEVKAGDSKSDARKDTSEEKAPPGKKSTASKGKAAATTKSTGTPAKAKKAKAPAEKSKPMGLTLPSAPTPTPPAAAPVPEEAKPKRRAASPIESDDDDDDGFQIEFPDGQGPVRPKVWGPGLTPSNNFSPAFGHGGNADDDEDADGEFDYEAEDEPIHNTYKPQSPVKEAVSAPDFFTFESGEADSDQDAEGEAEVAAPGEELDEIDLMMAAEMELAMAELGTMAEGGQGKHSNDQDSEESEEE